MPEPGADAQVTGAPSRPGWSSAPGAGPAFLAVDGGNSKTEAVVGDAAGRVLGAARGGPTCHQLVGLEAALETLRATASEALAAAGAERVPLAVHCLAGVDLPVDDRRLEPAVASMGLSTRSILFNDTIAVLRAGSGAGWGVGVVCGAGLNCAGLAPDGRTVRFPAMGELSGDLASGGVWLGTRTLGTALRAGDGRGEPTVLRDRVAAELGRSSPEEVLEAVYTGELPFDRLTGLAPVAFQAASAGDGPARRIVDQLADEIVAMVTAVVRRLDLGPLPVEVVQGGGIFRTDDAAFHQRVRRGVLDVAPKARFVPLDGPPVLGAALLAADELALGEGAETALRSALTGGDLVELIPDGGRRSS